MGRSHFVRVTFPIAAENGKEASKIARYIPRVKHNHKDYILDFSTVDLDTFKNAQLEISNDEYLHCKNKQEQNEIVGFSSRIEDEPIKETNNKKKKKDSLKYRRRKEEVKNNQYIQAINEYMLGEINY